MQGTVEESRGGKADRSGIGAQSAYRRVKRDMAVRIGRTGEAKGKTVRPVRCVQDDAGRLQRLTGDNVRPLMRPAQRQGGSAGWQYVKRNMGAHPGGASAVRQKRCA